MKLGLNTRTRQAQVFKLGQVIGVLQMSAAELDEHLAEQAQDNPFLAVARRPWAGRAAACATDLLETMAGDDCPGLHEHVMRELAGLILQGGLVERLVLGLVAELEPSGWLARPVVEIADDLGVSEEVLEIALALVQKRVSPTGLFARSLADCLRLQLVENGQLCDRMALVLDHLPALSGGSAVLAAATGLDEDEIARCLGVLKRLNPKPGSDFSRDLALMREPDVRVIPTDDGCEIEFSNDRLDAIAIRDIPGAESAESREAICRAKSLKRALDLRRSAVEKVVRALVERQRDYFRVGDRALAPLSLSDLAAETGFHLSTVSRVLAGLLIEGPGGIVTARALCPGAACTGSGPSKPQVVAWIRSLIGAEDADCPLSDARLAERLATEGVRVSRRVVSKYREELGIPAAPLRRRRVSAMSQFPTNPRSQSAR
ncbi:RNA polymerase subunit sigma-54 [Rhodobacterales bacterium HKCCE2091]|nr:RNA polymerase subunit sigma-54 [Rhodobacterales bacterium HKCCE2091]